MTPVRDLNDLYFFAKVADFGSYTAAAKALGLQTSKLIRAGRSRIFTFLTLASARCGPF
jgi:hypothetical protein